MPFAAASVGAVAVAFHATHVCSCCVLASSQIRRTPPNSGPSSSASRRSNSASRPADLPWNCREGAAGRFCRAGWQCRAAGLRPREPAKASRLRPWACWATQALGGLRQGRSAQCSAANPLHDMKRSSACLERQDDGASGVQQRQQRPHHGDHLGGVPVHVCGGRAGAVPFGWHL